MFFLIKINEIKNNLSSGGMSLNQDLLKAFIRQLKKFKDQKSSSSHSTFARQGALLLYFIRYFPLPSVALS